MGKIRKILTIVLVVTVHMSNAQESFVKRNYKEIGTVTMYYAKERIATPTNESGWDLSFDKGEYITQVPIETSGLSAWNEIEQYGNDKWKISQVAPFDIPNLIVPKYKVEERKYKVCELPFSDINDRAVFVDKDGNKATLFLSKSNGHYYDNKIRNGYVIKIVSSDNNLIFEEPLVEEHGVIVLGLVMNEWKSPESWDGRSAYSSTGLLLVDQHFDEALDHASCADSQEIHFIPSENALLIGHNFFYRQK